jgi:hypothetical protein
MCLVRPNSSFSYYHPQIQAHHVYHSKENRAEGLQCFLKSLAEKSMLRTDVLTYRKQFGGDKSDVMLCPERAISVNILNSHRRLAASWQCPPSFLYTVKQALSGRRLLCMEHPLVLRKCRWHDLDASQAGGKDFVSLSYMTCQLCLYADSLSLSPSPHYANQINILLPISFHHSWVSLSNFSNQSSSAINQGSCFP